MQSPGTLPIALGRPFWKSEARGQQSNEALNATARSAIRVTWKQESNGLAGWVCGRVRTPVAGGTRASLIMLTVETCPKSVWQRWLKDHVHYSLETAQNYMSVARFA